MLQLSSLRRAGEAGYSPAVLVGDTPGPENGGRFCRSVFSTTASLPATMIPTRHDVLCEAVDLINRAGTGLLTTYDADGGERLWIGTPVLTSDGHVLVSFLTPDHGICARIGEWPLVQWRFHDEAGETHLVLEGRATLVPGSTWRRVHPGRLPPGTARVFTVLVTTVESVQHMVPEERMSCRVVLPGTVTAGRDPTVADTPTSARTQQPSLAF